MKKQKQLDTGKKYDIVLNANELHLHLELFLAWKETYDREVDSFCE